MPHSDRIAFRATTADLANLAAIAAGLRAGGMSFANRSDALRASLSAFAATFPKVDGMPAEAALATLAGPITA